MAIEPQSGVRRCWYCRGARWRPIDPRLDDRIMLSPFVVQFCSEECRERYRRLLNYQPEPPYQWHPINKHLFWRNDAARDLIVGLKTRRFFFEVIIRKGLRVLPKVGWLFKLSFMGPYHVSLWIGPALIIADRRQTANEIAAHKHPMFWEWATRTGYIRLKQERKTQ